MRRGENREYSVRKELVYLARSVKAAPSLMGSAEAKMTQSFDIVEEKLREAEFFLDQFRAHSRLSSDARHFFSAFVSAARSVTLVLQVTMSGVAGFDAWYAVAQAELKVDPLAPFFREIRNDVVHKGRNPLNQVTLDHLREDMSRQMHQHAHSHVLVLPAPQSVGSTVLVDAVQASTLYFTSLVRVVFGCYDRFRCVVDPRWYFTRDNFSVMGKTFEDAVAELGLPPAWASCAPPGDDRWRVLRSQQPPCQINDV